MDLDLLNQSCSKVLVEFRDKINNLADKDELNITMKHACCVKKLMNECERKDYKFELNESINGIWEIKITK